MLHDLHALTTKIIQQIEPRAQLLNLHPVYGGSIHQSFLTETTHGSWFIKTNSSSRASDMFIAEQLGLSSIKKSAGVDLVIPSVIASGEYRSVNYLALEYLQFDGQPNWLGLAEGLVSLHRSRHKQFGFFSDNFIGSAPQSNQWRDNWSTFWWENRLLPQITRACHGGFAQVLSPMIDRVKSSCDRLLHNHMPSGSLVHGDLWIGNLGWLAQASHKETAPSLASLFDPACYYGDREVDIAMTQLFGGFAPEFYTTYQKLWPLEKGYQHRQPLYNLYHLLNHLNLFGESYLAQTLDVMHQIVE